ncbi:MAG: hypothetical protein AAF719_08340 [Pseudomonadota bacterium]
MKLRTKGGQLTLGSTYKLIVWGWVLSWGAFFGLILSLLLVITLITGEMAVNGEIVSGRVEALIAMAPIVVLFPIIITLHAFMFGGFITLGLWLYRFKRPIEVVPERDVTEF